jgi:hypothetical protein
MRGVQQNPASMMTRPGQRKIMGKNAASWIAVLAGFASSGLGLRVAFDLSLPDGVDAFSSDLQLQSVRADVAAIAAMVSVIAHVIDKASK